MMNPTIAEKIALLTETLADLHDKADRAGYRSNLRSDYTGKEFRIIAVNTAAEWFGTFIAE